MVWNRTRAPAPSSSQSPSGSRQIRKRAISSARITCVANSGWSRRYSNMSVPHQEGVAVRARRDRDVVDDLLQAEPIRFGQIRRQRRRRQRREGASREYHQHRPTPASPTRMSRRRDRRVPSAPCAAIEARIKATSASTSIRRHLAPVGRAKLGQCRLSRSCRPTPAGLCAASSTSRTVFCGHDPHFVPPLRREHRDLFDRRRHPFFRHAEAAFFLAQRDGRPVGRIEAIVNHAHNRFHDDRVGFFGAFESENDRAVSDALLSAPLDGSVNGACGVMRGPVTHSTNEECGLLVEGFEEPR